MDGVFLGRSIKGSVPSKLTQAFLFPSNRISCVYVRASFRPTRHSVNQSLFTRGQKRLSSPKYLHSQTILSFHKQLCAAPSLLPLWSLLDAAVFHYSQQTFGLHVWPHRQEHAARVPIGNKVSSPQQVDFFSFFTKTRSLLPKQAQYHLAPVSTFSKFLKNCFYFAPANKGWLFLGRKCWKIPSSYSSFSSDTLLSGVMVLFLNITRHFLRTFRLSK